MFKTTYILISVALTLQPITSAKQNYSMYVWTKGFDKSIPGCDVSKFVADDKACFSHNWDTREKRKWLWNTCNLTGREISAIYLSDLHHNLRDAYNNKDCSLSSIQWVRETVSEGHLQVPNLKIYALYAVSDLAVSERNLVKYVVYYNDICAGSQAERLDGVATNNEAYSKIKCGDMGARLQYLNNLHQIIVEAGKQKHGKLLTHYSVSWHWGKCDGAKSWMTWNNKTSDVISHMIDIFDSIDIQVGYIRFPQISDRVKLAGYDYAMGLKKNVYVTVYTNKVSSYQLVTWVYSISNGETENQDFPGGVLVLCFPITDIRISGNQLVNVTVYTNKGSLCQTTFFPSPSCDANTHTEANMFAIFDQFSAHGIPEARPCIHYFRGSYSSGGSPEWPKHNQAPLGRYCWRRRIVKTETLKTVQTLLSGP